MLPVKMKPGANRGRTAMRAHRSMRRAQRGMSFWSLLFLLFVFGFFILLGLKTIPIYLNQLKVDKNLRGVARDNDYDPDNPLSLMRALEKRWDLDDIEYLDYHQVKVVNKLHGRAMSYDYEARQNLFMNVFVVIHFQGDVPLSKSAD
jgi:hypothetical protein